MARVFECEELGQWQPLGAPPFTRASPSQAVQRIRQRRATRWYFVGRPSTLATQPHWAKAQRGCLSSKPSDRPTTNGQPSKYVRIIPHGLALPSHHHTAYRGRTQWLPLPSPYTSILVSFIVKSNSLGISTPWNNEYPTVANEETAKKSLKKFK